MFFLNACVVLFKSISVHPHGGGVTWDKLQGRPAFSPLSCLAVVLSGCSSTAGDACFSGDGLHYMFRVCFSLFFLALVTSEFKTMQTHLKRWLGGFRSINIYVHIYICTVMDKHTDAQTLSGTPDVHMKVTPSQRADINELFGRCLHQCDSATCHLVASCSSMF